MRTEFGSLDVSFDEHVLEPRQWTLAQSQWAADLLRDAPPGPVLELFAGVGHIGLAAVVTNERELVLVDLNPAACALARRNVEAAGMSSRVEIREGSIDEVLRSGETFSVVVADPPWVRSDEIGEFPDDPSIAIDGGADGLDLARSACAVIDTHLAPGGSAILQLGSLAQVAAITTHLVGASTDLRAAGTRQFDDGVLVRLSR